MTPLSTTSKAPERGAIKALDRIFHREGPLTAADLRELIQISVVINDLYNAADMLQGIADEELQETVNLGGCGDPSKLGRVHQARHAMARCNDLAIERIDPDDVADEWPAWAEEPKMKP